MVAPEEFKGILPSDKTKMRKYILQFPISQINLSCFNQFISLGKIFLFSRILLSILTDSNKRYLAVD